MHQVDGFLVMVDNPAHHADGDFALDDTGHLLLKHQDGQRTTHTFSGLASFKRDLFTSFPPGKLALRPVLESAIDQHRLKGELHTGLWSDIGDLERLAQARQSPVVDEYISSIKPPTS